jgi:NAD(P)-dependent dehydrogenase (short-subunit alcohol dehydrogenase family)
MSETTTAGSTAASDLFDLSGRRALVTGASRGIGRAIAVGLAARGAEVLAVARSEEGLRETAEQAASGPGSVRIHAADLLDHDAIEGSVTAATEQLGGLDILVNNAADDHDSPIEKTDFETWRRIIDLNLQSCWLLCKAASAALRDGGGKVINVASMLGLVAVRNDTAYIAAKHGLVGLTRGLALEWARRDVQVNALAPGFVETDMMSGLADEQLANWIRRNTPAGRWAQPEEMVGPVVFLASPASGFMTGQVLVVDGGWTAQ